MNRRMILVAGAGGRLLVGGCVLALLLCACDSKTPPAAPGATDAQQTAAKPATAEKAQTAEVPPPPQVPAAARRPPTRPLGSPTGTFVDRHPEAALRVVSYNILWNNIFVEQSPANADKFVRVVRALDPDVLLLQEIGATSWMLRDNPDARDWGAAEVAHLLDAIAPLPEGANWHAHRGTDCVTASKYPLSMPATSTIPKGDREQAMALVDLPDGRFAFDLYVMNNHYKCCDPEKYDVRRQKQSDAIVAWIRDIRTPGGEIDLADGTAIIVGGDLNIVGSLQPITTLVEGDIIDETRYGSDFPPDWDGTGMVDSHPLHNIAGPDDYTWRNDKGSYDPGRLDYIIYTDSVLEAVKKFVLNTTTMSEADLKAAGLEPRDICPDTPDEDFDHLPVVVDFRIVEGK